MAALSASASDDDVPDYLSLDSPLATLSEQRQLQRLRELLGEATLAAYAEMPEVASDVALLRYLQNVASTMQYLIYKIQTLMQRMMAVMMVMNHRLR